MLKILSKAYGLLINASLTTIVVGCAIATSGAVYLIGKEIIQGAKKGR